MDVKPVRKVKSSKVNRMAKIPIGDRVVRAEGSLEPDYFSSLKHDPNVLAVVEQPVRIHYRDSKGKRRSYTPDALVTFRDGRKPQLVEVKPQHTLERKAEEFAERFEAARVYALERGWEFLTVTDTEIRTVEFENLEFLSMYRERRVDPLVVTRVLDQLLDVHKGRSIPISTLLDGVARDDMERAHLIPVVWHLVAVKRLRMEFSEEITMSSLVRLAAEEG